jgi:hypothetical protein
MSAAQVSQTSQLPFKPGERIAVPYMNIAKVENNIAYLTISRPKLYDYCMGEETMVSLPFYVKGAFKVELVRVYKVPRHYVCVRFNSHFAGRDWVWEKCLPDEHTYIHELPNNLDDVLIKRYAETSAEKYEVVRHEGAIEQTDAYIRRFKHMTVIGPLNDYFWLFWWNDMEKINAPLYAIYEFVSENEATLVDNTEKIDYVVLFKRYPEVTSIKAYGDGVIWSNYANCRSERNTMAAVIARYGAKIYLAEKVDWRYEVEEWLMEFPPRRVKSYYVEKTEPIETEEVV